MPAILKTLSALLCALAVFALIEGLHHGWVAKPLGGHWWENAISVFKGFLRGCAQALYCLATALLAGLAARHIQPTSALSSGKTKLFLAMGSVTLFLAFIALGFHINLLFGENGFYTTMSPKSQALPWLVNGLTDFIETLAFGFILIAAPRFVRPAP